MMHHNPRLPYSSGPEEAECELQLSPLCRVALDMLSLSDQDHGCVQRNTGSQGAHSGVSAAIYTLLATETYLVYGLTMDKSE